MRLLDGTPVRHLMHNDTQVEVFKNSQGVSMQDMTMIHQLASPYCVWKSIQYITSYIDLFILFY